MTLRKRCRDLLQEINSICGEIMQNDLSPVEERIHKSLSEAGTAVCNTLWLLGEDAQESNKMLQSNAVQFIMDEGIELGDTELKAFVDTLWKKAQDEHAENKTGKQLQVKYRGRIIRGSKPIFWVYIHREPSSEIILTHEKSKQEEIWNELIKESPDAVYRIDKMKLMAGAESDKDLN